MTNYQIGDTRTCKACGEQIRFVGPYWVHMGEHQPRHIGEPAEANHEPAKQVDETELTSTQYELVIAEFEALKLVAAKAERLVYNATSLQPDQFNPESYEVYADDLNGLAQALVALDEVEEKFK